MNSIIWKGRSTSGMQRWQVEENSFLNLYDALCEMNVISETEGSPLEKAKLKKLGKSPEDYCVELEDGDVDMDYDTYQQDIDSVELTDRELMDVIEHEDGNAYYQKFYREENEEIIEITSDDFNGSGKYKY